MAQVRVHNFSVSLDGFGTGKGQSLDAPFGHATGRLMEWFLATRTFHAMHDKAGTGNPNTSPPGSPQPCQTLVRRCLRADLFAAFSMPPGSKRCPRTYTIAPSPRHCRRSAGPRSH